jgi:thioredoxin reductase
MREHYDVIVIGGGAAGLSGALMLGRSRRSVLVIDAGEPRNAPAEGMHGFLSRDGMNPLELLAVGRDEVRRYGVEVADGRVRTAGSTDRGFAVTLDDGSVVHGRRLLVTTGLIDELPEIPGLRERWGREVVHCPYCHGWEIRDQAIGVLASGGRLLHRALLFRQLSDDVTVFLHTEPELTDDELEQLAARDINVVRGEINALEVGDDRLTGIRLRTGEVIARDALAVAPRFVARAEVLESLGLEPIEHPLGLGSFIESDPTGATAVPGVWVAGNVADLMAQVVGAAASGSMAGAAINADLIARGDCTGRV